MFFSLPIIFQHWLVGGSLDLSSQKTKTCLHCITYIKVADILVVQSTMASAAMTLTGFSQNILVLAPEGLRIYDTWEPPILVVYLWSAWWC